MIDSLPQLKVLRKIKGLRDGWDGERLPPLQAYLWEEYTRRKISIDPLTDRVRTDVIDPRRGWVDNDLPRDEWVTNDIMERTGGFAVAGYLGQIIKEFKTFAEADKARLGATVRLDVSVDGIEDDEPEDEEESTTLAGKPRRQRDVVPA